MRRNNKALYEQIMRTVSKEVKYALNEAFKSNDLYDKNDKILKRLRTALKDNPDVIVSYPKNRDVAAIITFKDPRILKRINHNYQPDNLNLWLEIESDLKVYLVEDHYNQRTEVTVLSSKNLKQLIDKLQTMSFMNVYNEEDEEYSTIPDEFDLEEVTPTPQAIRLTKELYKTFTNLDNRIRTLVGKELYNVLRFEGEIHLQDKIEDEFFEDIDLRFNGTFNDEDEVNSFSKLITFAMEHPKAFNLVFGQHKGIDYLADEAPEGYYDVIETIFSEYYDYITKTYPESDYSPIMLVWTNYGGSNVNKAINEFIDLYTKYVEFLENNFNRICNEYL